MTTYGSEVEREDADLGDEWVHGIITLRINFGLENSLQRDHEVQHQVRRMLSCGWPPLLLPIEPPAMVAFGV